MPSVRSSMAVAMRERFADLARAGTSSATSSVSAIGIATGYATLGRIGFEGRYDYAAIGNAVILASRLSTEAEAGQILLSQRTYAASKGASTSSPSASSASRACPGRSRRSTWSGPPADAQ